VFDLTKPAVFRNAAIAALMTALASYPRLSLWLTRQGYAEFLTVFLGMCAFMMWLVVFGWHEKFAGRPPITLRVEPKPLALSTIAAVGIGALMFRYADPSLREIVPKDFPQSFQQWTTGTLFRLAFIDLFLIFAPFAWFIRLTKNRTASIVLTIGLGVFIWVLKARSSPGTIPASIGIALLLARTLTSWIAVALYVRGGAVLVWWFALLIECRHLVALARNT